MGEKNDRTSCDGSDLASTAPSPLGTDLRTRPRIFPHGEIVAGCYEVREVLGSGSMGQVFEAFDHALNRKVAVKVAWPDPRIPPLRDEARALAAFRTPSLPVVHAIGEHRGVDYLVMERVYGLSLSEYIARRVGERWACSAEDAIKVLLPLAEGLSVVHRAGIAHRDVKPANVMLCPDGRIVLLDFGLMLPEFEVANQTHAAGSPAYMAPEALANETMAGGGQLVDIYALGVVAFKMLAGRLPHRGDGSGGSRTGHEPPAALAKERPDLPGSLVELVGEMMAFDPGARVQSVEAVSWRLRAIRDRDVRATRRGPVRVLVVDDDPHVAEVLAFYTRQILRGADVRVVRDGEEAVTGLDEHPPDVVLLDLQMPRMNGIEVCMYLRGASRTEPCAIVPVSAGVQEHDRQLLHQLGIHHFVHKGGDLRRELARVLGEVCAVPSQ